MIDPDNEELEYQGEEAVELAPYHDARPLRQAWRSDPENAPLGRPVYVREPDSMRVLIGLRDDEGWVAIKRDGELRSLEAVASWASLGAAMV
jgi:hypothetical protein